MLNELVYCPRLFCLEHVQGEFADNFYTVEGRYAHRRVDSPGGAVPASDDDAERDSALPQARSVLLGAVKLGAIAKIDLLDSEGGSVVPVDYKRGAKPDVACGAHEPERVQVCVQGLILRENGYEVDHGEIYFVESHERVRVDFDEDLVARTKRHLEEARSVVQRAEIPPPLVDSPKCVGCSLVGICLPDEVSLLRAPEPRLRRSGVRRLLAADAVASPVYLQAFGTSLGKSGDNLEIREKGEVRRRLRLLDVSQVNVFGNIQVSTAAIVELCRRDIPVCYFTYGGWFVGMTTGTGSKNIELRIRQFAVAADEDQALGVARRFVEGKILNCRTLLRRNTSAPSKVLAELRRLARATQRSADSSSLLGVEGAAARLYFSHFDSMLKGVNGSDASFDFEGRNRRPPKDPVNCLLSFLYAMLAKDCFLAVRAAGLDPFRGFFHQPRPGRPGLALDLLEEFRPLVADSVVLQLINTGEIRNTDFIMRAGACALTSSGRRRVIEAYERRVGMTIVHPLFRYSVTYRRVLEIQARLLGRFLTGEIRTYPPFRTR